MDPSEKRELLEFLRSGRHALTEALSGVDDNLAAQKPPTGGWSILDCVEHITVTEELLAQRLQAAYPADQSYENRPREARFLERATNRSRRIEAPEPSHPSGRYANASEALAAFDSARGSVLRFVDNFDDDPRCWITDHPMIQGPVNCFEMLLMIGAHPGRHAKQIVEIKISLAGSSPMSPSPR
ncbi:MAG TPA: DinB family protein [Terracidiphilus sp.]|jgi:hypothetical protein|nr:DinB family protein [Terracidiphilus sp.]